MKNVQAQDNVLFSGKIEEYEAAFNLVDTEKTGKASLCQGPMQRTSMEEDYAPRSQCRRLPRCLAVCAVWRVCDMHLELYHHNQGTPSLHSMHQSDRSA